MKLQSAEEFLKLDPSIRHDDCDHTWDKVIGWMDEYAAQALSEYKEKLRNRFRRPNDDLPQPSAFWTDGILEIIDEIK